jgi:membrane-bound serine protease (ClpP class)
MRRAAVLLAGVIGLAAGAAARQSTPVVFTAEVDGIIHPVTAEFIRTAITRADAADAALLVITLRTPGGLLDSTREINSAIIGAKRRSPSSSVLRGAAPHRPDS